MELIIIPMGTRSNYCLGSREARKVSGCAKPPKGSFRLQNRFSPFSTHISIVLPIACQVYIAFGVYGQPHVLTLGYSFSFECVLGHIPPKMGHFPMS